MTDKEAIEALQRGDHLGMDALVAAYQKPALRIAYRITGSPETAQDIVADAFLVVYQKIKHQDPSRPFEPWFYRIVVNKAISVSRRDARFQKIAGFFRLQATSESPDQIVERNADYRSVLAAVARLPARERAVLMLRYVMDLDERSIADLLGWPLGSVKTRLRRARQRVRAEFFPSNDGQQNLGLVKGETP